MFFVLLIEEKQLENMDSKEIIIINRNFGIIFIFVYRYIISNPL